MDLTKTSKRLSLVLRHKPEVIGIRLDKNGWANVNEILAGLKIDRNTLEKIVSEDLKGRYSFDENKTKIRANQGHSVSGVEIEMEKPYPPEFLYHGTATRFLEQIMRDGLKPMKRQYVHISQDFETAVKVGARHGKPAVLVIRAQEFVDDGNELFLSANGVWQAKSVPVKYFSIRYVDEKEIAKK